MSKKAVMTLALADLYKEYGKLTFPLIRSYAEKCGADFKLFTENEGGFLQPAWNKLYFVEELFDQGYDSIMHIDSDMLVRPDTPDLFALYSGKFVCSDENKYIKTNPSCLNPEGKTIHSQEYKLYAKDNFNFDYEPEICLNTGIFIIPKEFRDSFMVPKFLPIHAHYEQPYMNLMLYRDNVPFQDLDDRFNKIDNFDNYVENLSQAFVPHFSGNFHHAKYESNIVRMQNVLNKWRENAHI